MITIEMLPALLLSIVCVIVYVVAAYFDIKDRIKQRNKLNK
jgi:hypothetical protein